MSDDELADLISKIQEYGVAECLVDVALILEGFNGDIFNGQELSTVIRTIAAHIDVNNND